ncbi:MAG: CdaR family protein [Firmicutes bacterium]|nr:CdaR family protein [Bacillota bacterium]MDD7601311.1 CdaR family protein [Bacillota bacterium]MDY5856490.1 CdaR family protein [Anaerovoracaceae bacterium]
MLKNDKVNFVIALILAIGLWVYVFVTDNQSMDTTIKNVPITIVNEDTLTDEGLVLLSVSDESISVSIKGDRGETGKIKKEDIRVILDLQGMKAGENTALLQISVPDKVDFKDASRRKVTVLIDELVTEEKNIVPTIDGEVSVEQEPYIVQTDKDTVRVTGAKSVVDRVKSVSAPLDVKLVGDELRAISVNLVPVDENGDSVEDVRISEKSVSVTAVMLNKKTVPLKVTVTGTESDDAERTVTVPKTITVKGYASVLADISYITAETIDVSDIYEDTALPVKPLLPEGVEAAANSQNLKVKVAVKGMETRRFTYGKEAVIVEGITENCIATVDDVNIVLTVVGKEEKLADLSGEEFYFVADVSGLKPGEHRVELVCRHSGTFSDLEYVPREITVNIEEIQDEEPEEDSSEEE